jgi:hypothetical protein
MQLTVTEHQRIAARTGVDKGCVACHMPERGGRADREAHKSHAFAASRSPSFVKSALSVRAKRVGSVVELVLSRKAAGHAVPTGDLFRRIAVTARIEGEPPNLGRTRYLARHFGKEQQVPGVYVRVARSDDRVGAGGVDDRAVRFDLGERARGRRVSFRVVYQRVDQVDVTLEDRAIVDGEIELASGTLD